MLSTYAMLSMTIGELKRDSGTSAISTVHRLSDVSFITHRDGNSTSGWRSHPFVFGHDYMNFSAQDISAMKNAKLPSYTATPGGAIKVACINDNGRIKTETVFSRIRYRQEREYGKEKDYSVDCISITSNG